MPGIDRLTLLCDRAFDGTGLTAQNARRARADLCKELCCSLEFANELSLHDVVNVLEGLRPSALPPRIEAKDLRAYPLLTLDYLEIMPGNSPIPIYPASCRVVHGDAPSVCPHAAPPLPRDYIPHVEKVFREFGQVPDGCTVHWIGHEAWKRNLCHCFPVEESGGVQVPTAEQADDRSGPGDRETEILKALLLLNAEGQHRRVSRPQAAHKADPQCKPSSYAHAVTSLARRGFVRSKKGPNGGIWLTPEGTKAAKELTTNRIPE